MFRGSMTALITPFKDGGVDEPALRKLVDWQINEGTHALVPVGTTGESPTLSHAEHGSVVEIVIDAAAGRVPIIAGAGSNATAEAVAFTQHAEKAGASAVLHVTPYYNKPTQDGLFAHFETLNNATSLPIFIYNIPGRSVVDMMPETMGRLAKLSQIAGVKDATAMLDRVAQQRAACGEDFIQISGEDATAVEYIRCGGQGCISVVSNVTPKLCAEMQEAALRGDFDAAEDILSRLMPLIEALFCETSPSPVKYAMMRLGFCDEEIRLPLLPASADARAQVDAALRGLGLI